MAIEMRPITADELDAYIYADAYGFGYDPEALKTVIALEREGKDVARILCAFDGGKIIGALDANDADVRQM